MCVSQRICGPHTGSSCLAIHSAGQDVSSQKPRVQWSIQRCQKRRGWPVQALVELACNVGGNSAAIATASMLSLAGLAVPCNSDSQLHWHLRWLWPVLLAWPCGLLILQGVVRTYGGHRWIRRNHTATDPHRVLGRVLPVVQASCFTE